MKIIRPGFPFKKLYTNIYGPSPTRNEFDVGPLGHRDGIIRCQTESVAKVVENMPEVLEALEELIVDAQYALDKFLPPGSYNMQSSVWKAKEAMEKAGYKFE